MSIQTPFRHRSMEVNPRGGIFSADCRRRRKISPREYQYERTDRYRHDREPMLRPDVESLHNADRLNNQELRFVVRNRMLVSFGTAIVTPFDDYDQAITASSTIGPNEFVVLEFPTVTQTWESPGP